MPEIAGEVPLPRQAGSPLANGETLHQSGLAALPEMAVVLFSPDLRFRLVAGDAANSLDLGPGDLVGRTLDEAVRPTRAALLAPHMRAALAGEVVRLDLPGHHVPGTVWAVTFTPVRDGSGAVVAGLAVARDVSAARAAEQEAVLTRKRLQSIADSTGAATFLKDTDTRALTDERGEPYASWGVTTDVAERERFEKALGQSLARLGTVFEEAPLAMAFSRVAPDGSAMLLRVNAAACDLVGYERTELIGTDPWALVPDEDRGALVESLATLASGEQRSVVLEHRVRRKDGSVRWSRHSLSVAPEPSGETLLLISHLVDETERRRSEQAVRDSEMKFSLAFDNAPVGMSLCRLNADRSATTLLVNDQMCDLLGRSRIELITEGPWVFADEEPDPRLSSALDQLASGQTRQAVVEREYVRPDGQRLWLRIALGVASDREDSSDLLVISHVEDITTQRDLESDLRRQALHDQLTGLPNRALLDEQMRRALDRLARRGGTAAVVYVDIDDFKQVNDRYGHGVGDEVLISVAEKIRSVLRATDTAARLGGDEFVVLCEDLADVPEAVLVGERVVEAVREPSGWRTPARPSISAGLATTCDPQTYPQKLLGDADRALARAKRQGKNRLAVFPSEKSMSS